MSLIRAQKTTRNYDDFKVMVVGSLIALMMMLIFPVLGQGYDKYLAERPFITATVQIIQTDDYERPMVLYDADAKQPANATWVAVIRDIKGQRLESRRGNGNYSVREDNPRLWTWAAFFDNESGIAPPTVPHQPFKVCLQYYSKTRDTGIEDETPEVCSLVFYPDEPYRLPVTVDDEPPL